MKPQILDEFQSKITRTSHTGIRERSEVPRILPPAVPEGPSVNLTLFRYWAAIRRYALRIALFVVVTVACTGFFLSRIPKEYEGTATVRVDPSVPVDVVGNQSGSSGTVNMGSQLATDMNEIVSPAVVTPTVLKLGLWKPAGDNASKADPSSVVAKVMGGIKVSQVAGTYLLNISYRSTSPSEAATVANGLAQQFIDHEYQTRNSALLSLSKYMRQQIQELSDRMQDSQLALNGFERDNNIVNPDDMSSLLTQQLSSLQQELGQEQERQRTLKANLALAEEGNVDALLVSDRGSALGPLLKAQQQAELELDSLAAKYGPGNYLYQQQRRKLAQIKQAVQNEQQHVVAQIQAQAKAAAVKAGLTGKELAAVKAQLDDFNRKNVQFAILKRKSDTDKELYDNLLERVNSADITAGYHSTALRIVDPARPNTVPVYPRIQLTLLFAFLLSGFLGVLGAVVAGEMDRTLSSPEAVRDALGAELLGFLPEVKDEAELKSLVREADAGSGVGRNQFAESLSGIRSTLLLKEPVAPLRAIAVVSCQPQEGKTTVSVNLAASFAALGKRTVVVDGDLLRPRMHRVLDVSNRMGLSSLLLGQASMDEVLQPGPIEQLTVLPAGPSSARARELMANEMDALVEELKSRFDIVILDTPPVLGFADALNVAPTVDELVFVVRAGKTPRDYVQVAMEQLRQVRAPVAGIVLNGVKPQASPNYYWYSEQHYQRYAAAHGGQDAGI